MILQRITSTEDFCLGTGKHLIQIHQDENLQKETCSKQKIDNEIALF